MKILNYGNQSLLKTKRMALEFDYNMKIEKSSYTEIYNVETEKYDIAIQYHEDFNLGYSEFQILSVQDKDGLEIELTKGEGKKLKDCIVEKIMKSEKGDRNI